MQLSALAGAHPVLCSNSLSHSASCKLLLQSRMRGCSRGKLSSTFKQRSQVQRQRGCTSKSAAAVTASEDCALNVQFCKGVLEHRPDSKCTFQVNRLQDCVVSILPARLMKRANCKCQMSTPYTMRCMGTQRGGLWWWCMVALVLAAMQSMRKSLYLHIVHAKSHIHCAHIQAVLEDSPCHVLRANILAVHMLPACCFAGH